MKKTHTETEMEIQTDRQTDRRADLHDNVAYTNIGGAFCIHI